MKEELKDSFIKARISSREKEDIQMFCEDKGISISDLIRIAVEEYLEREA